jgi:hypothetical protein
MANIFVLMNRSEDALKAGLPTLQFVDVNNYDRWLIVSGTELVHREAELKAKMSAGPDKRYRIIIEEIDSSS